MTPLESQTILLARSYVGTREITPNSNPDSIDKWLAFVHCQPGSSYCAAFVSYVVTHAAGGLSIPGIKFRPSAGALHLLDVNPDLVVPKDEAAKLLFDGVPMIAVWDHGSGKGHTGFATRLYDHRFDSIESNTNGGPAIPARDRDGDGTYARTDREFDSVHGWLRIA